MFNERREFAVELDQRDPLSKYRSEFYVDNDKIYMDGNSLGLLSRRAEEAVLQALWSWKTHAIEGWTEGSRPWFDTPEQLASKTAALLGAKPHECMVAGSTTSNLHTMLATFYRPQNGRTKLVVDSEDFPTDLYAAHSHVRLHGLDDSHLVMIPAGADGLISEESILRTLGSDVQVLLLPAVWFKSGQLLNMERIVLEAHKHDIIVGLDLCHSIGSVEHRLHDWNVDFAVWCNYKYLNGGPGATAGYFVHERHHHRHPGLAGWFGTRKDVQFDMAFPQVPALDARAWQMGTPGILSTVGIESTLDMMNEVGLPAIRRKSLSMTDYLRTLLTTRLPLEHQGTILTPVADGERGGHIAWRHPDAVQIAKALRARGVIPDFRGPDVIRLAPIALYSRYVDVWETVERLRDILLTGEHHSYSAVRDVVS